MSAWKKFPYPNAAFDYAGNALKKAWPALHAGDQEPYPDAKTLKKLDLGGDIDAKSVAQRLEEAWRAFHSGQFKMAVEVADALGAPGAACASKAQGIYASALESDASKAQAHFQAAIARCEAAIEALPEQANAHYFLGYNLGRYSQSISIAKALAQGLGGKIKRALERTLDLAPAHAEAHTALGVYHAEIVEKVGGMLARLTYGASADLAVEYLERGIELTPQSPIAHLEYGRVLKRLYGRKRGAEAEKALRTAAELTPRDAMEEIDRRAAEAELG